MLLPRFHLLLSCVLFVAKTVVIAEEKDTTVGDDLVAGDDFSNADVPFKPKEVEQRSPDESNEPNKIKEKSEEKEKLKEEPGHASVNENEEKIEGKRMVAGVPHDQSILTDIIGINEVNDVNLTEGDIKGLVPGGDIEKRNAIRHQRYLWKTRVIPYTFHRVPRRVRAVTLTAINEFHKKTCLRFVPYRASMKNTRRLVIFVGRGCWSYVGKRRNTGKQYLSIGRGCEYKGIVMHELMHAIGFYHEQSRSDRNKYVEILWENIQKGKENNFRKYSRTYITGLNEPYDYDGLMHYGARAFTKNGKPTIRALNRKNQRLGQRNGFSTTDRIQINKLYKCQVKIPGWTHWTPYSPCTSRCYKFRQRFCFHPDLKKCKGSKGKRYQTRVKKCSTRECRRDGHWGRWSHWSNCKPNCGYGTHTRTRKCDDPKPMHGGKPCTGINKQSQRCYKGPCNLGPDDCTFEKNACFWKSTGRYSWTRSQYHTPSVQTGPPGDHTLFGEGHYMYFEATGRRRGSIAVLESKLFKPATQLCFSFWYSMYGRHVGSLRVKLKTKTGSSTIWIKRGNQGMGWKQAHLVITTIKSFKIQFIATRGPSFRSDIAIDDVFFGAYACAKKPRNRRIRNDLKAAVWNCDFDSSMCGLLVWYGDWKRVKSNALSSTDHTTGKGYFVASSKREPSGLETEVFSSLGETRCFEAFIKKQKGADLSVVVAANYRVKTASAITFKSARNGWHQIMATIRIPRSSQASIHIEADGQVVVDDISITKGHCFKIKRRPSPSALTCAFETNFCQWTLAKEGSANWVRKATREYYLALKSGRKTKKAILRSLTVYAGVPYCMEFEAFMSGNRLLHLSVSVVYDSGKEVRLFTTSQNTNGKWVHHKVNLPTKSTYHILLVGTIGIGSRGYVKVDEIYVSPGRC